MGFRCGVAAHAGDPSEGESRSQEDDSAPPPLPQPSSGIVGEDQHGTGVEVQLIQLVVQVVVEEPARPEDTRVVHKEADVQVVRGLSDDRQEVVRRQIDRDDSGVDGMSVLQVVGQLSQAVVTPGDQHQVDALGGELSGEGFADPRRSARHHGPGSEAAGKIVHAILHWE